MTVLAGSVDVVARIVGVGVQLLPVLDPRSDGIEFSGSRALIEDLEVSETVRTNLFLANESPTAARARITIRSNTAKLLAETVVTVPGDGVLRIPAASLRPNLAGAYAEIDSLDSARLYGGASVVRPGDATFAPARVANHVLYRPGDIARLVAHGETVSLGECDGEWRVDGEPVDSPAEAAELVIDRSHLVACIQE